MRNPLIGAALVAAVLLGDAAAAQPFKALRTAPAGMQRFNPLFLGQTPNCNAGIVSNNQGHLGCVNTPIGYTIREGPAAQQLLYVGTVLRVNAGAITTKTFTYTGMMGGLTQPNTPWGYTIKEKFKPAGSVALYVVVGCGANDGEVTVNPTHKNCSTVPIGFTYPQ